MNRDTLEKKLEREKQKNEILENMIEGKTRNIYFEKEKFREQSEFLKKVIDSVPHPFFVVNADDYSIIMANSSTHAGTSSKKIHCYEVMHHKTAPCINEGYLCPLAEVKRTKKPVTVEHVHSDIPNNTRLIQVFGYPILDNNGDVAQMIEYTMDITEQKESLDRFKAMTENTSDWIWEVDENAAYTYASPRVKDLLGYEPEELIGRTLFDLMPPEEAERVAKEFGRIAKDGMPFSRLENTNLHKDGHHVVLETSGVPILDANKHLRGYRGIDRDITVRKEIEERNRCQLQRLTALRKIDMTITASLDQHVTLNVIINEVIGQLKVDAADILLYKPVLQTLEYAAGSGFRTQALQYSRLKVGESYAGQAASERCVVHIPDLHKADGFRRSVYMTEENFISYYGVPLIAKGNVTGVLEVFHRSALEPDDEWLGFLESLAGQAAIAIDSAALFEGMQRSNLALITAYDATIEGWSRALNLRDKETEGHSHRVTELTVRIAHAMGIRGAEQVHIRRGALLHDIGKMGIPDRILLKPGPLNEEEWEIMRKHPVFAYEMLSPIDYLRPALDIPYCHHEKMDGTGYPRGLKGEQIPLSARIFAVVDILDALSSDRPYRPAWPNEKVLEHIRSLTGGHLDPNVVETFLENEKDLLSLPVLCYSKA